MNENQPGALWRWAGVDRVVPRSAAKMGRVRGRWGRAPTSASVVPHNLCCCCVSSGSSLNLYLSFSAIKQGKESHPREALGC